MGVAHVESIDALKALQAALWKFNEAAEQALSEATADLERTLNWLEHDARCHWQAQARQRKLDLNQARESLRSKQAVTRPDGSKPRAIEEEQAVAFATARLQQAEEKLGVVRQNAKAFQREVLQYRGLIQRFVTDVRGDVPEAVAHLDGLIGLLTKYASSDEPGGVILAGGPREAASSVKRPETVETGAAAPSGPKAVTSDEPVPEIQREVGSSGPRADEDVSGQPGKG